METIREICKRLGISTQTYYNIANKLKKRPTDEDLREYKKTAKVGRPRKESF